MNIKRWVGKAKFGGMIKMTAKPMAHSFIIKASKADSFIKQSNDNVISKSFLERCKEASKLFNR